MTRWVKSLPVKLEELSSDSLSTHKGKAWYGEKNQQKTLTTQIRKSEFDLWNTDRSVKKAWIPPYCHLNSTGCLDTHIHHNNEHILNHSIDKNWKEILLQHLSHQICQNYLFSSMFLPAYNAIPAAFVVIIMVCVHMCNKSLRPMSCIAKWATNIVYRLQIGRMVHLSLNFSTFLLILRCVCTLLPNPRAFTIYRVSDSQISH